MSGPVTPREAARTVAAATAGIASGQWVGRYVETWLMAFRTMQRAAICFVLFNGTLMLIDSPRHRPEHLTWLLWSLLALVLSIALPSAGGWLWVRYLKGPK